MSDNLDNANKLIVRPRTVGLQLDIRLEYSDIFDWWRAGVLIEGQGFIGGGYKNPMYALTNLFKQLSDPHGDPKLSLILERFIRQGTSH